MNVGGFGRRREGNFEPPIEMRFVDLFMIIVVALMFITVMLSIISAFVGSERVDASPRVATEALPMALVNKPYSLTLAGLGGSNPYTWRVGEGALPSGLSLAPETGVISGVPGQPERSQFVVEMVDGERRSDRRQFVLDVLPAGRREEEVKPEQIRVASPAVTLPDATNGLPYNFRFTADGGQPPYQWAAGGGELPTGLNLLSTGDLIGTPNTSKSPWDFAVVTTDATGVTVSQNARLLINAYPTPLWERILGWLVYLLGWGLLLFGALFTGTLLWIYVFKGQQRRYVVQEEIVPWVKRWRGRG